MDLGMVGLGRMGANMTRRLLGAGHRVVVYDLDTALVTRLEEEGAVGVSGLEDLVGELQPPRAIWMMVPAAVVASVVEQLAGSLSSGDVIVDGGNSHYLQAVQVAARLAQEGVFFVDVGTSGGIHGLERGYCLMIGGEAAPIERLEPVFASLAPGVAATPRTPGRSGEPDSEEHGYLHCGPPGAGHFTKMVHNGIEYGLMAAYAEGLNVLRHAGVASYEYPGLAVTGDERYGYDFQLQRVAEVWRRGSVIGSWLLDLVAQSLLEDPELSQFSGRVTDSGEGRWTVLSAVEEGVPAPVLSAALYGRFDSRGRDDFANKALSAMRYAFGGHRENGG